MDETNREDQGPSGDKKIEELEQKLEQLENKKTASENIRTEDAVYNNQQKQEPASLGNQVRQEPRKLVEKPQVDTQVSGLYRIQSFRQDDMQGKTTPSSEDRLNKPSTGRKSNTIFYAGVILMLVSLILAALAFMTSR